MKKVINLYSAIVVLATVLNGCSYLENENGIKTDADLINHVEFEAVVLEITDTSLLVEPVPEAEERQSSDRFRVNKLDDIEFKQGDQIKINYDGTILESYPAQLNEVYVIEIIE